MTKKSQMEDLRREQKELIERITDKIVENITSEFGDINISEYCKHMDICDIYREEVNMRKSNLPDFSSLTKEMQHLIFTVINFPEEIITDVTDTFKIGLGSIERFLKRKGYNKKKIYRLKMELKKCVKQ